MKVKCEICGKEVETDKKLKRKWICEDCYNELVSKKMKPEPLTEIEITMVVKKRFPANVTLGEIERELIRKGWEIVQVYEVKEI